MGRPLQDEFENTEGVKTVVQKDNRTLPDMLYKFGEQPLVRCVRFAEGEGNGRSCENGENAAELYPHRSEMLPDLVATELLP